MKLTVYDPTQTPAACGCDCKDNSKPKFFEVDKLAGFTIDPDVSDDGTIMDLDLYDADGNFVQTLFTYSLKEGIARQPLVPGAKVVKNNGDYPSSKVYICA